jgi:hypothetical protein
VLLASQSSLQKKGELIEQNLVAMKPSGVSFQIGSDPQLTPPRRADKQQITRYKMCAVKHHPDAALKSGP